MNLTERKKMLLLAAGLLLVVALIAFQRSRVADDKPPQVDKEAFFRQINSRYGEVDSVRVDSVRKAANEKYGKSRKSGGKSSGKKGRKKSGKKSGSKTGNSSPTPSRDPLNERL